MNKKLKVTENLLNSIIQRKNSGIANIIIARDLGLDNKQISRILYNYTQTDTDSGKKVLNAFAKEKFAQLSLDMYETKETIIDTSEAISITPKKYGSYELTLICVYYFNIGYTVSNISELLDIPYVCVKNAIYNYTKIDEITNTFKNKVKIREIIISDSNKKMHKSEIAFLNKIRENIPEYLKIVPVVEVKVKEEPNFPNTVELTSTVEETAGEVPISNFTVITIGGESFKVPKNSTISVNADGTCSVTTSLEKISELINLS